MRQALIGHTGFVGSVLDRDGDYQARFNSRNIGDIEGESFDRIVCAGVSAVKWLANKEPEADWAGIERLLERLAHARAKRFTLISTVDVYPRPVGVTEDDRIDPAEGQPYGRHRLAVETWVRERFERVHIVRLPALFGPGLKKNVIFDMLNDNNVSLINPNSRFQWYDLERLSSDLAIVEGEGLELVNIAAEPVATEEIRSRFFPEVDIGAEAAPTGLYDMRSLHAERFGGSGGYQLRAAEVLERIGAFVTRSKGAAAA